MALARDQGDGVKQLEHIEERLRHYVPKADWDEPVWTRMRGRLGYRAIDFRNREDYTGLAEDVGETSPLIAYFATPALVYSAICENLAAVGLCERTRVVMEKPIGYDLESSKVVNDAWRVSFPKTASIASTTTWQGNRPEPHRPAFRQQPVRDPVEPELHLPRGDHRGREGRHRGSLGLLRPGRPAARHGAEPPAATALPDRHGSAGGSFCRQHPRREGQGAQGAGAHHRRPARQPVVLGAVHRRLQ